MVEFSMWTVSTVLSERPPTDPMDKPWPPEQVPPVKMMFYNRQYGPNYKARGEKTYSARVNSQTIILILHIGIRDSNPIRTTNIKSISVVTTRRITSRVINRDRIESECVGAVNAENLYGGVQDLDVADRR
jgi:hypothetical protein